MLPPKEHLTVCFAHASYDFQTGFSARKTGIASFQVRERAELEGRIGEADVLVTARLLWNNDLVDQAKKLQFIQSASAGVDHYARDRLAAAGVRLASAQGVNANAVADHAMGLLLTLSRRLSEARDNQAKGIWRDIIVDLPGREDELADKTLLIVGLGPIGARLARLAKAFDMRVIGIRRDVLSGRGDADVVFGLNNLHHVLPEADYVALTCPLTKETENLINTNALARMKPSSFLINVARGRCVDEPALIEALQHRRITGAALDVTVEEPLPLSSPLWGLENAFITPHTAGETRRYEENVLDLLMTNLGRLWRGDVMLQNQIV